MTHIAKWKKEIVKQFTELLTKYPIVGIVNMENLPTSQLQQMREQLREQVLMKMTKKRLLKIAFDNNKDKIKGIEKLEEHLKGMPAILFTKENPFKLYKIIQQKKTSAPAKAGQVAPNDVLVPKGPTPFAPGPIIGELGALGIKAGIENGKVAIKEDKIVLKEGEVFSDKLASILTRLNIHPMEIGLDLVAVLEDGEIFTKSILSVDEKEYINNITQLAREAFNLAINAAYPTTETTEIIIQNAFRDSKSLALEINFLTKETVSDILSKAYNQMLSLSQTLPDDAKSDELKNTATTTEEPKKEDTDKDKPEQKKEEEKPTNAAAGLGAMFG